MYPTNVIAAYILDQNSITGYNTVYQIKDYGARRFLQG